MGRREQKKIRRFFRGKEEKKVERGRQSEGGKREKE